MKSPPRVSILMPAYNASSTIADAIASALAQTEPGIEVLVIDDASTDATARIAQDIARLDARVCVIRAACNGGPGAARNLGISVARGKWIGLLDADDRYHPSRLERLLGLAHRTGGDMVADNLMAWPAGRPSARRPLLPERMLPHEMRLDILTFIDGAMGRGRDDRMNYGFLQPLFRRDFLVRHGIRYPAIRFSEDYIFTLECLLAGAQWWLTPEPLYEYRMSPCSLTTEHPLATLDDLMEAERRLLQSRTAMRQAPVAAALRRHIDSVDRAKAWRLFAQAVKRREFQGAAAALFSSGPNFAHISAKALGTLRAAAVDPLARAIKRRIIREPEAVRKGLAQADDLPGSGR